MCLFIYLRILHCETSRDDTVSLDIRSENNVNDQDTGGKFKNIGKKNNKNYYILGALNHE